MFSYHVIYSIVKIIFLPPPPLVISLLMIILMCGIALLFKDQLPFAVIGSDRYVTVSGKPVLGRKTKWGLIEGENCMNKLAVFLVL